MAEKNSAETTTVPPKAERKHRATYANDKRSGGYLVRVAGPYPNRFAGKEVPVTTKDGGEHIEKLLRLVWTGTDNGEYGGKAGEPVSLYTFESRPRDVEETEF
jgi:hypothetical protein